ncbi:MAG: BadF/BadG/BcrA/BcrD ATPase family protein [Sulfolobales archaeon]|nr:BadF/BadG/BcrA/BcrD ATPase family protein [Sulfolobales archaeon]
MGGGVLVGVDAGGTKTEVAAVDLSTRRCSLGSGGPSNPAVVGVERAGEVVADSIRKTLGEAGFEIAAVGLIAVGAAGVVGGRFANALGERISKLLEYPADRVLVFEDVVAAHSSVFLLEDGVVGVLGTGSCVYGSRGGVVARAGGWGHLLGDEGSGYRIGLRSLREVLECFDGLKKCSDLANEVSRAMGFKSTSDVLSYVYYSSNPKTAVSSVATLTIAAYRRGSEVAAKIVEEELEEFVKQVAAVHWKLGGGIGVGFVGSVYGENRDVVESLLREKLSRWLGTEVEISEQRIRTSCGAIVAGLKLLGDRAALPTALGVILNCCLSR